MRKMTYGQRFKMLRTQNEMTQDQLVAKFNYQYAPLSITKTAVSQYENEKRMPETPLLIIFAEFFDVSVDYLLGLSEVSKRI